MKPLLAALIFAATPAQAICPELTQLFEGSRQMALPNPFEMTVDCTTSLALSGQTSTHCAWAFPYRAPEALDAFTALVKMVLSCFDTKAGAPDRYVNHPDFYDLRLFSTALGEVGVSLKDKGGLQQTYVFLRVTPAK